MALSILDGNQSATTLSSVVTGGEHIVAHSVVSLGSNAISNIATAVSGSTVCVGNLGLLQSTVATEGLPAFGSFIKIGGHTGTSTTGNIVHVSAVGALRVDGSVYTQPVSIASVTIGNTVTIAGTVTANPTGTQTIAGTVTANVANEVVIQVVNAVQDGDGTTFGVDRDFPISGTVTAGALKLQTNNNVFNYLSGQEIQEFSPGNPVVAVYASLSGAVPAGTNRIGVVTIGAGTVTLGAGTAQIGSVTVGNSVTIGSLPAISGTVTVGNSVTIGSLPAISGTVTANSSNGSLTTRFGSVTTANTAFETSAVTNANRKYLLIQNVTTASNVITVGIGFTPTTTQGIQLFAGAGLTFEGSYIPTGAVNLLSSVTASCYTILEA